VLAVYQARSVDLTPLALGAGLQELHVSLSGITDGDLACSPPLQELRVLLLSGRSSAMRGCAHLPAAPADYHASLNIRDRAAVNQPPSSDLRVQSGNERAVLEFETQREQN